MSLLDQLAKSALQSVSGSDSAVSLDQVLHGTGALLQSAGGIDGLIAKFNQAGFGHVLQSWIGTGQNATISGAQLTQVLGADQIGQLAQKLGLDHAAASNLLAQYLPQLVDHLTPNGQAPASHTLQGDMFSSALNLLKGKLLG